MATPPTLDKRMATQMVMMFDKLYHLGVSHSFSVKDEGLCRQFLENTSQPGIYGYIEDGYYVCPREWQLRLQKIAGEISLKSPMYKLFGRMGNYLSNFLGCFMPLAQDFYNKGVSDYLNYGHKLEIAIFDGKTRVWLTAKGLKNASKDDYKQTIQQFCFDRKRTEENLMAEYVDERKSKYQHYDEKDLRKRVRNPKHYDTFVRSIGILTQKDYQ